MKNYSLLLSDEDHLELKITAAKLNVSMRVLISASIGFFLDNLESKNIDSFTTLNKTVNKNKTY